MEQIIRCVESTPSAHRTLCTKFQAKGWIDVIADCSVNQLVQCALERIRQDSSEFPTFLAMLHVTAGLRTVANKVEKKMEEFGGENSSPSIGEP
jgi:hypothetical protein